MPLASTVASALMKTIKTYSELITLPTFRERFEYLKLGGSVGADTFGYDRYLNQMFYSTAEWQKVRRDVIVRDHACDLAVEGLEIPSRIIIHHMNPIAKEDVVAHSLDIINPEYLICTSFETHNAIHYGVETPEKELTERRANDTCPWRK